jgi:hypothetical protein
LPDISALNGTAVDNVREFDGLTVTPFVGLLDTYTGAAAGYSVRRLATAATVLMRVRRETGGGTGDDDEADVAYDSNNILSLDSAISNASAGVTATTLGQFLNVGTVNGTTYTNPDSLTVTASCFVDEWKDQSGNANHAEQATHGSQPQIHDGTVNTDLILENGKPALQWSNQPNQRFDVAALNLSTKTLALVWYPNNTTSNSRGLSTYAGTGSVGDEMLVDYPVSSTAVRYIDGGITTTVSFSSVAQNLSFAYRNASVIGLGINGGTISTNTTPNSNANTLDTHIGDEGGTALEYAISHQEVIIWPSDQDTAGNRTGIETDINDFFGIY